MIGILMRSTLFLLCLSPLFLFAQNSNFDDRIENNNTYDHIDLLIKRAKKDIDKAIKKGQLTERVALVSLNFTGNEVYFKSRHREYLLKSIEALYQENKFFHFVKSIKALNKVILNENLNSLKFINPKNKKEIEELTKALGAEKYAVIDLNFKKEKIELSIQIRDIERHENYWKRQWSVVWRRSNSFILLGIYPALSLDIKEFPLLVNFSVGKSFYVLANRLEMLFFLDIGSSFINLSNSEDFQTGILFLLGVGINIDILEWFRVNYEILEYFLTLRFTLLEISYRIPSTLQTSSLPTFAIGNSFIINANYNLFFEVNLIPFIQTTNTGAFFFSLGFKYRFEI